MQYLTNHSNSEAGTLDIIAVEERKYWYRGLRQAELTIREKKAALSSNRRAKERAIRELQFLEESLVFLRPVSKIFRPVPLLGTWIYNRLCDQEDKSTDSHHNLLEQESLFRDSQAELEVAIKERDRIVKENPEVNLLSFQELEARHGTHALLEQRVNYLAPRLFAAERGIPVEVAIVLFEASPEDRHYLLERILEERAGFEISEETATLVEVIASASPDLQQQILSLIGRESVEQE